MTGIFITLEGGEGVGKSTQIPLIRDYFEDRGYKVVCTREPGGTPTAERLRDILKIKTDDDLTDTTELLLMYAARAQLTEKVIKPALAEGKVVICDRYDLSTVAYQGGGRGIPLETIEALRKVAIGDFEPDITFLLDLPVEEGMKRARGRGTTDRIESSALDFFDRVRQMYLNIASHNRKRIKIISAWGDEVEVNYRIKKYLNELCQYRYKNYDPDGYLR